jgi:hypothetical protein
MMRTNGRKKIRLFRIEGPERFGNKVYVGNSKTLFLHTEGHAEQE